MRRESEGTKRLTIDVDEACPVANQPLRCPEQVIHADAKANLLDHPVGVLGIDVVLDSNSTVLLELRWCYLHQVRDFCLQDVKKCPEADALGGSSLV
jgi:hypothetical protein